MSNPILTSTSSKLDTRVKEPSGVVPPPSGYGSPNRFTITVTKNISVIYKYLYLLKFSLIL